MKYKHIYEKWNKTISEEVENDFLDYYSNLVRKEYVGLVFALVEESETVPFNIIVTCAVSPDLDGFIDEKGDTFIYNGPWYDIEPLPIEMLSNKWQQTLADYQIDYPFKLQELINQNASGSNRKTIFSLITGFSIDVEYAYHNNEIYTILFRKHSNPNRYLSPALYINQLDNNFKAQNLVAGVHGYVPTSNGEKYINVTKEEIK